MNIHKHMEAIFVVALFVVGAGTLAFESLKEADAGRSAAGAHEHAAPGARAIVVRA